MKRISTFITIFFLILACKIAAQAPAIQWSKCYGGMYGDRAKWIEPTTDGGYIVAGYSNSNDVNVSGNHGGNDFWVAKLTSAGTLTWQKSYGGSDEDHAASIKQTADGGYIVVGYTRSIDGDVVGIHPGSLLGVQTIDFWVIKISNTGTLQWQKCYGGNLNEEARSVEQTSDGGYVIAGVANSNNTGDVTGYHYDFGISKFPDYWVVRTDASGNLIWEKCYGSVDIEEANSVKQTSDGGFIVVGFAQSRDTGDVSGIHNPMSGAIWADFWIVKLDAVGSIQWQKCLGGTYDEQATSVQQTSDGGYIVAGATVSDDGDISNNLGGGDVWVVKLNNSGTIQWEKTYGGLWDEAGESIQQTGDGGYIIGATVSADGGDVAGGHGGYDFWALKISALGTVEWQKCLGGSDDERIGNIKETSDGYIVTGLTLSNDGEVTNFIGGSDYWVVKLGPASCLTTLAITASAAAICQGSSVTFNAAAVNESTDPVYQWQVNGNNVGSNSNSYTTTTLNDNDTVVCVMTGSAACVVNPVAVTDTVIITVSNNLQPSITISADNNNICSGTTVTFTAIPQNGGTSPMFQWKKNGVNIGTNNPTYSDNNLNNGDIITCFLTSDLPCVTGGTVQSNNIVMAVNIPVTPSITISAGNNNICQGTLVNFIAVVQYAGSSPVYQWKKNGINIGTNAASYNDNALNNGDVISCTLTSNNACVNLNNVQSNEIEMIVNAVTTPSVTISTNSTNICSGTTAVFNAVTQNAGTPTFEWKKNGINVGTNSSVYTDNAFNDGDVINCVIVSGNPCAAVISVQSNLIVMNVNPLTTPAISIAASTNTICQGTPVTFTATALNGGSLPVYQWTKNGINTGINTTTYTDNNLNNADVIKCMLVSNYACVTINNVQSNSIIMTVNPIASPSILISAGANNICEGTSVTFTAAVQNAGSAPSYQWRKNGLTVGANTPTYLDNSLSNGDLISCELTTTLVCVISGSVESNVIAMQVRPLLIPSISINASALTICPGATDIFTASITNGGTSPVYHWQKNGTGIGNNSSQLIATDLVNADTINCLLSSNASCVTSSMATSNYIIVNVKNIPPPVSLGPDTAICSDNPQPVILETIPPYNIYAWQDGSVRPTLSVTKPGIYFVTVTDANGCKGSDTVNIKTKDCINGFYIPTAFTPNNDQLNDVFKPLIFGAVTNYEFSVYNRWGQLVFKSNDINRGWDGNFNGAPQNTQVFTWICTYKLNNGMQKNKKGYVTLIR